jgi:thiamine-monophosphate kinase
VLEKCRLQGVELTSVSGAFDRLYIGVVCLYRQHQAASNGLAVDARRLAEASGAGVTLDLDALPLSDALRGAFDAAEAQYLALNGGDDYELCFSVAHAQRREFESWCHANGHVVTRIGQLDDGSSLTLTERGEVVSRTLSGFDHFAEEEA